MREPLLLKEWDGLSSTRDPMSCWLIDKARTNGKANRSKIWAPRGTEGWGETVRLKGGYIVGYELVCRARRGPKPADAPNLQGVLKPYEVDHWCHSEDLTCPGGGDCQHRRCLNGDHMDWVSPATNQARRVVRERRRNQWLSGVRSRWPTTVAEEADEWIRERHAAVVPTASERGSNV